jgi:hypothetical protein
LTRSYESNGPEVKIRGNAHHIAEKYLQLARDSHTSGDPVAAENYLQHAEHYFRLIAAAQAAQAHAQSGRPPGEGDAVEIEDDEDFGGVADRFASPVERTPTPAPYAPQPFAPGQPNAPGVGPQPTFAEGERQPQQGGEQRGGYQQRQDRPRPQQQDRGPRQDRPYGDRQERGEFREGRRDFKPREFRPYRDPNPPRENPPPAAGDGAAALPSFITAAPRVPGPMDAEVPTPQENVVETNGRVESGDAALEVSGDPQFPGRARRRRLRSPYGFRPSANQDEESEGPVPPSDAPVSE